MRPPLTDAPCSRCLALGLAGGLRMEMVQRLPEGAFAPRSREGTMQRQCFDCASAEFVATRMSITFQMARVAVGNERQEQYRLPGVKMGLVNFGYVRPSQPGDLDDQHAWLDRYGWFEAGLGPDGGP